MKTPKTSKELFSSYALIISPVVITAVPFGKVCFSETAAWARNTVLSTMRYCSKRCLKTSGLGYVLSEATMYSCRIDAALFPELREAILAQTITRTNGIVADESQLDVLGVSEDVKREGYFS